MPAHDQAGNAATLTVAPEVVRRIRSQAVWSLSLFAAAVPATLIGGALGSDPAGGATASGLLATLFWGSAAFIGLLAAAGALRHWAGLSPAIRWLGLTPLAGVGLAGLAVALLTAAIG